MSIEYLYGIISSTGIMRSRDTWVLDIYEHWVLIWDLWVLEIFEFYRYIWDPGIHEFYRYIWALSTYMGFMSSRDILVLYVYDILRYMSSRDIWVLWIYIWDLEIHEF